MFHANSSGVNTVKTVWYRTFVAGHAQAARNTAVPPHMGIQALLVDDEPSILLTLGLVLRSQGFELQTADSAQAATALLAEAHFDLVVTDLSLEYPLTGFEVVRAAILQPTKPTTIVISGYPDLLNGWKECGADAGMQSPLIFRSYRARSRIFFRLASWLRVSVRRLRSSVGFAAIKMFQPQLFLFEDHND